MRKEIPAALLVLCCAAVPARGDGPVKAEMAKPAAMLPANRQPVAPAIPPLPEYQEQTVVPETNSQVFMSSSDANRIVCPKEIKDVIFSGEKGVSVKVSGRNAFVKFRIQRKDDRDVYSQTPTELYVVCGESVYPLIAVPKRIPAQTVKLSPGAEKVARNAALYGELPFEKKVIALIRAVYTGEIPEGFTTIAANRRIAIFRDLDITLVRSFRVEGEGLRIDEFRVSSRKNGEELRVTEKDFLRTEISARPVGIALDRHTLKQGESGRVIVVGQALATGEGGANGVQGED